jgi:hypothetical protein
MTKKELKDKSKIIEEQLMKMPELETEQDMQDRMQLMDMTSDEAHKYLLEDEEEQEEELEHQKLDEVYQTGFDAGRKQQAEPELIHKRMNDINTFQAHENELYLRGTDEYGKDFQVCFDSYNFLEWIDTEHLKYIKKQLIKHIKSR